MVRRAARSTGRWPRRWRSARCCSRAPTSASPARTRGGARSRQRHSVLVDHDTGARVRPARPPRRRARASSGSTTRCCRSTPRSASSTATRSSNKDALVLWEAQFGDFVNGAQIIIDQYLVAAEDKWGQTSGLVAAAAARLRGPGPRALARPASSASSRCAPRTTSRSSTPRPPAQYFHLLRRQMHRDVRKPLVVFTPKSLLRARPARSPVDDLTRGSFQEVLDDPASTDPGAVQRVVLCSGKVGHDAIAKRQKRAEAAGRRRAGRAALPVAVRPRSPRSWPATRTPARSCGSRRSPRTWALGLRQGPPVRALRRHAPGIRRVSRFESGSPATGSHAIHVQEQEAILDLALSLD